MANGGAPLPSDGGAAGDSSTAGGGNESGGDTGAAGAAGASAIVPVSCSGMTGSECQGGDCCATTVVTAGTFYRGTDQSFPATVSAFALDDFEVTVGRFKRFIAAYAGPPAVGAGAHPLIPNSGWSTDWDALLPADQAALTAAIQCDATYQTYTAGTANDQRPINCVTWYEAFAFCAWDGGRLPTETEWEYAAAGGTDERLYPWGDTPVPSNAQDATVAYATYYGLADGSPAGAYSLADILPVGSKPAGKGKFGQLDLAGSMWEWTLDWFAPFAVPCVDCSNLSSGAGGSRVLRGGSAYYPASGLAAANRDKNVPGSTINDYGFRCARAPQ